jgi:hypothetical protein
MDSMDYPNWVEICRGYDVPLTWQYVFNGDHDKPPGWSFTFDEAQEMAARCGYPLMCYCGTVYIVSTGKNTRHISRKDGSLS